MNIAEMFFHGHTQEIEMLKFALGPFPVIYFFMW
jgi:hypothetical protein